MNIQERWKAPDHPFWKKVGNVISKIAAPAGTLVILLFVPQPYKEEAIAVWVALTSAILGASKLTTKKSISN